MTPEHAMKQAWQTSSEYARNSLDELVRLLGIDQKEPGWRTQLAPFAPVWAAMIAAASADFDTAVKDGRVSAIPK